MSTDQHQHVHASPPSAGTPLEVRRRLFDDESLGMGTFLDRVLELHPAPDTPFLWAAPPGGDTADAPEPFSLNRIAGIRDAYAAWYHENGVRKGDPVGVYLDEGIGYFLHYLALSSLGAVPALVNGNMAAGVAADYMARIGVVGTVASARHLAALQESGALPRATRFRAEADRLPHSPSPEHRLPALFPYPHADQDPVMLCHTSGTTGAPKAAMFGHRQFFLGKRERLLEFPQAADGDRLLTALPQAHSAGISYLMTATLLGLPTRVMADTGGEAVREAMRVFHPTLVVAFPQTYVELAGLDLDGAGADAVHTWINTGDSAHEAHIRELVRHGRRPDGEGGELPGSRFVDGLGSSEMGMALFRKVSAPETGDYGRCVGVPIDVVDEVAVLDEEGRTLPDGYVGRLGVRTPTVTPGYWNDSARTVQSSFSGYWLTGDIVYRSDEGRLYHVDRVPDVIHTTGGPVYSLPMEEVVLGCAGIADCAVFAVDDPESEASVPFAVVRLADPVDAPRDLLAACNRALSRQGMARLRGVTVASSPEDFPTGPTGKVLKRRLRERFATALTAGGRVSSETAAV
ncbi:acyl-CoA synthetase (AMP-forming)/AMP-acid ligase II [Haloactinospora alba]|uniref:Acyl-CoA synthetase (AMP-forming)/AMP-acid ligase II n=1 Tax=Haloactinospora alba TaxID=405555 RepID=A0A543N8Z2_9ACTN|nr:class I adenylate-forming enzyme family protein [Haloactinospora alba]TQN28280.1 acyl-CoA synthetase (AMP-forming)/AMP-acid ligase II [Haloactinospora alba]